MIAALLLFTKVIAWAVLLTQSGVVVAVTIGRWTETPADRLRDILYGRQWPSRVRPTMRAFVSAAWIVATWGVHA